MEITWQVAPHVYLNADSRGSVYCALTGRASYRAGSLLLHGWAFIKLGLNVERLPPPLFVPPARSWGAKDVKRSILVGLVRNQGSQWPGKERAWGVEQDRKPACLLRAPAWARLLHVLALEFCCLWKALWASPGPPHELSSLPVFCADKPPAACQSGPCVLCWI